MYSGRKNGKITIFYTINVQQAQEMEKSMHQFTGYELLWLFFIYSFGGWILETVLATWKQRKFANRGLVNGPFCVIYGITAVCMAIGLQELDGFWLFIFAVIYATIAEWISGHLIEKAFKERWWDYSERRWNLDGYICLTASLMWGVLGFITVRWTNYLLLKLILFLPGILMKIILLVLAGVLVVDILGSFLLLTGKSSHPERWEAAEHSLDRVESKLRAKIVRFVDRRIHKAYPKAKKTQVSDIPQQTGTKCFAAGCGFYKIVSLFMIGAFLGDITETIFCRVRAGVWVSRSSVVWGPFSIVWGLAIALVSWMLYQYRNRSDRFLFLVGTLLGGAYEYLCSVFTELVFGKVFWDYSKIPFNLGGRINLLYCFFWGIAAVVWFKALLPKTEKLIEMLPVKAGKVIVWLLVVFMSCNIAVSCMALIRYDERSKGVEAVSEWQKWSDTHYDDVRLQKIYPNAIVPR